MTSTPSQDKIGLWPLTSLVTGNLVGSGVYLLPATLAIYGVISISGWIMASLGAILLSLVFANLSSRQAKTGGPYLYAREAFGDTVGYYVCWGYWVLMWMSNPALAIGAVGYISSLCGGLSQLTHFWLEVMIVASLTAFNLAGMKVTCRTELGITALKVIPLLILPLIGLYFIDFSTLTQHVNVSDKSFGMALNAATLAAMWAFVGLETGTIPAGQVYDACRTVPRATILGTVIAAAVYILGAIVVMGVVSPHDLLQSKAPYADAAERIFGGAWGAPVTVAAIISCLGSLNGYLIIVGRIPYGAAQDGLFPKFFTRTTSHGTPYWGVLISSLCSVPLLFISLKNTLMEQFNFVIEIAVTLILLVYTVSVLAYLKVIIQERQVTFYKITLGVSALIFTGWSLWAASFKMVGLSLLILILGIPMRLWMQRKKFCMDQA
ncbi:MAG: amino acid permease [Alphaproteobacteria bacterium]|nr:amino acid permease [Alphaproteobacteria bacterium]